MSELNTLTITNLGGPLTRRNTGDIKSGLAKYETSWGYDPYSKPGNLTWMEQPVSILSGTGGDANGVIVAMKTRPQTGTAGQYGVRAISSGRALYHIRVNDDSTTNPNFDSPSVLATSLPGGGLDLNANMVFYGNPLKIFHLGNVVAKVNFDGSAPASIANASVVSGSGGLATFLGKVYFGNGNNIGEIDSTELLVTERKLSPGLPENVIVKDLDVTTDGNYLQLTVSELDEQPALDGSDEDTGIAGSINSHKFLWNGIDSGATASEVHKAVTLTANDVFGDKNYSFGLDQAGAAIFQGSEKIITLPKVRSPNPGATFSTSNMLAFCASEYDENNTRFTASLFHYGQYDNEVQTGLYRLLRHPAQVEDDVIQVPTALQVSNLLYTRRISGYTGNIAGRSKVYFSTVEEDAASTSRDYKLWRFETAPTGNASIVAGTYETQTQMFSKKVKVPEVRIYTEPLIGGNDFIVDLIGSGGSVMAGGSQRFQVATGSVATGTDMVHFNPGIAPTYALGVRITNSSVTGVANWTANKIEVDYAEGGR